MKSDSLFTLIHLRCTVCCDNVTLKTQNVGPLLKFAFCKNDPRRIFFCCFLKNKVSYYITLTQAFLTSCGWLWLLLLSFLIFSCSAKRVVKWNGTMWRRPTNSEVVGHVCAVCHISGGLEEILTGSFNSLTKPKRSKGTVMQTGRREHIGLPWHFGLCLVFILLDFWIFTSKKH